MTIPANTGTASSSAKISDINALITAINTEFAPYATKASVDALAARVAVLEAKVAPPDLTNRVKDVEDKLPSLAPVSSVVSVQNVLPRIQSDIHDLQGAVADIVAEPDVPDLTGRVAALEDRVARFGISAPSPVTDEAMLSVIPHTPRPISAGPELVYDKATLYLGDMELHALRIAENKWRLVAQLNYITINQIQWTYDETVTGTTDEVYAHALVRLKELAELKPKHDAVHARVRAMSEGVK